MKSSLKPSAPMLASIALRFARRPKTIAKFATFINAKINVPGLDEEQEQIALEKSITVALDAASAAIDGKSVLSVVSLRSTTLEAVMFLRDHLDELDTAIDIPFVPDALEAWATEQLAEAIDSLVIPWIESTPRLQ